MLEPLLPTEETLVVCIIEECEAARLSELPRFHPSGSGLLKHLVKEGAKTEPPPAEAGTYPIVWLHCLVCLVSTELNNIKV